MQFSTEPAPVLLDIYDFWRKLGTIGVTSRIGIIFAIYKKGNEKGIENHGPISLLKLRL